MIETDASRLWINCVLGWTLLGLSLNDVKHFTLPNAVTLPLICGGLAVSGLMAPDRFLSAAFGAIAGYVAFVLVALVYRRIRGVDGLGGGDAKLLAVAGAWNGYESLPSTVSVAAITALGFVIFSRFMGSEIKASTRIPFGPFLAFCIWVIRLHDTGSEICNPLW